jgi:hypothetical protein
MFTVFYFVYAVWYRTCATKNNFNAAESYGSDRSEGGAIPVQAWAGPSGSRRLRLPEFLNNQHTKLARLSALRIVRLCPQEIFQVLISVRG